MCRPGPGSAFRDPAVSHVLVLGHFGQMTQMTLKLMTSRRKRRSCMMGGHRCMDSVRSRSTSGVHGLRGGGDRRVVGLAGLHDM